MDLVDEQNVIGLQIGEQRGQVARLFDHRARGLPQVDAELVGDDVAQRGLAEPGRAEDQHVVECLATALGSLDIDLQLLAHRLLAKIFVEPLGTDRRFGEVVFARGDGSDEAVFGHWAGMGNREWGIKAPTAMQTGYGRQ